MTDQDLHWLAGLLEGEGSFMAPSPSAPAMPRVQIQMTDRDIIVRVAALFGVAYVSCRNNKRNSAWRPAFAVCLRGSSAAKLMRVLWPLLGIRRRAQIDRALKDYRGRAPGWNSRKLTAAKVSGIRAASRPIAEIAREFGVSRKTVRDIRERRMWRNVA